MRHLALAARAHHFGTRESVCLRGLSTHGGHPQIVMVPTAHTPQVPSATGRGTDFSLLGAIGPSQEHLGQHASDLHRLAVFSERAIDAGQENRYVSIKSN